MKEQRVDRDGAETMRLVTPVAAARARCSSGGGSIVPSGPASAVL
jgi:hypothetical protein